MTDQNPNPRRWGMTIPLNDGPLASQRSNIVKLEELGYSDLWSAEAIGVDGITPLALASVWAPSMRLGTAILPAFTRGPALMAQTAAAMAEAAPGRFVLGVGTSSNVIVENWNSIPFVEPYKRTRDMVRFLRAAFTGEKVTETYDSFEIKGFRLQVQFEQSPKILVAALREGMLRMAGREADGAIVNWLTVADVPTVAAIVREQDPSAEIAARIFVVPTDDADTARLIGRFALGAYVNVPVYRAFHEWMGRGAAFAEHWEMWAAGDRKGAMAAISDETVDSLVVHGTAEECRARISAYLDNGIDTAAIAILPGSGVSDAEAVERLSPPD